ncbi:MAG: cupin domain-containing protein [Myxococcales bacterium]|nr:cupin domain-containing protein [Myxococcales bacterium]
MRASAQELIERLGLEPHPKEGGFFREVYRSAQVLDGDAITSQYGAPRHAGTAIYYLLTPTTYSHLHRLRSDEIFHFYVGDPCEMLQLHPGGTSERMVIGADVLAGERPQVVVPAGSWQGLRLVEGGSVALHGCTVAPGFDYADYEHGDRDALVREWPGEQERIVTLTA